MSTTINWQEDRERARRHHFGWWKGEALVVSAYYSKPRRGSPQTDWRPCPAAVSLEQQYTDIDWILRHEEARLAEEVHAGDILPIAHVDYGPGALALYLGCEGRLAPDTIWYDPIWAGVEDLGAVAPLRIDPENRWWKLTVELSGRLAERSAGRWFTRFPDLVENIDILASLRGTEQMLIDMIEEPDWVAQRLGEIDQAFETACDILYPLIREEDGSSVSHFGLWGPGKTYKVQCDAAAMISRDMFDRFVVPSLTRQCHYLDHSMFHLDGPAALQHLDSLLAIAELDAIQWTPGAGVPRAADESWHRYYHRIREAGKSLQVNEVHLDEVVPLLRAIGGRGVYLLVGGLDDSDAVAELERRVRPFRQ